jgi:hypothetical protein
MKKFASLAASISVLASSHAWAMEKTRAEVYRELVQANQEGRRFVTETSYPDVAPQFAPLVAQLNKYAQPKMQGGKPVSIGSFMPGYAN